MKTDHSCEWPGNDPLMKRYHDEEWGMPVHNDRKHFEFLLLDAFQAGLSWKTILHKRDNFSKAFAGFDVAKVSAFTEAKLEKLMLDEGIIRNRLKIYGAVKNAKAFMKVQEEFGSFDAYIWRFVNNKPVVNEYKSIAGLPARTEISDAMSKDLKKRGFTFVGSTICYAYMQAAGLVNDHITGCPRKKECKKAG